MEKNMDYEDYISADNKEFNAMQLYLTRLHNIINEREEAFIEGDVVRAYRSTLSLMSNTIPKLLMENVEYIDLQKEIRKTGNSIKGLFNMNNEKLIQKNKLVYLEELRDHNTELDKKMFKASIVYPKEVTKTVKEWREKDY